MQTHKTHQKNKHLREHKTLKEIKIQRLSTSLAIKGTQLKHKKYNLKLNWMAELRNIVLHVEHWTVSSVLGEGGEWYTPGKLLGPTF